MNGVRVSLFERFAERYFPGPDLRKAGVDEATSRKHAEMLAGNWVASRRADSTFLNITQLIGQTTVGVGEKGKVKLPEGFGLTGHPSDWVEVSPFVWHDLNSQQRMAAVVENGEVKRWSLSMMSAFTVFERPPLYKNAALVMPLLLLSLGILVLTALLWPVRRFVRGHYKASLPLTGRDLTGFRLSRISALAIVLVFVGWATVVSLLFADLANLAGAFDPIIVTLQVLTIVVFFGGLAAFVWYMIQVWRGRRSWWAKLWSIALVFAGVVAVWVGLAFHLMNVGTNY